MFTQKLHNIIKYNFLTYSYISTYIRSNHLKPPILDYFECLQWDGLARAPVTC